MCAKGTVRPTVPFDLRHRAYHATAPFGLQHRSTYGTVHMSTVLFGLWHRLFPYRHRPSFDTVPLCDLQYCGSCAAALLKAKCQDNGRRRCVKSGNDPILGSNDLRVTQVL